MATPQATAYNPSKFTSGQVTFINQYASRTGLNPAVVAAQVYNEENGTYAQQREAQGNHDWLNIGHTDTANLGTSDSIWNNPISAANASAAWVQGKYSVPGFGYASPGIQGILRARGQSPADQISALQNSGWATGRYPSLPGIYQEIGGQALGALPQAPGGSVSSSPAQGGQNPGAGLGAALAAGGKGRAPTPKPTGPTPEDRMSIVGRSFAAQIAQSTQALLNGGTPNLSALFSLAKTFQEARSAVNTPKLATSPPLGGSALARGAAYKA